MVLKPTWGSLATVPSALMYRLPMWEIRPRSAGCRGPVQNGALFFFFWNPRSGSFLRPRGDRFSDPPTLCPPPPLPFVARLKKKKSCAMGLKPVKSHARLRWRDTACDRAWRSRCSLPHWSRAERGEFEPFTSLKKKTD